MAIFNFENTDIQFEKMALYSLFLSDEYRQIAMTVLKDEYFDEFPYNIIFKHFKILNDKGFGEVSPVEVINSIQEDETFLEPEEISRIKSSIKELGELHGDPVMGAVFDVDFDYLLSETELFCQNRAVEIALMESVEILEDEKKDNAGIRGMLDDALGISLMKDNGLIYSKNPLDRFLYYQDEEDKIPFKVPALNKITNGGFGRKTINCFMAGTGLGKTLMMTSLATDYLRNSMNVLYVTLEISEQRISMRCDSNLLEVPQSDFGKKKDGEPIIDAHALCGKFTDMHNKYDLGELAVKEFPTGGATVLNVKALIKELARQEQFIPDVIFIDYINLMNSYRMTGKNSNSYTIVKSIAEELRGLAVETNTVIITATQVNRDGISGDEVGLNKVSESAGLPHTTDFFCGLYQTEHQREQGMIIAKPLKNRYSEYVNTKHALGINYELMKIYHLENEQELLEEDDSAGEESTSNTAYSNSRRRRS